MLVHLGSKKEKETERKREKEIIKNNKEGIFNWSGKFSPKKKIEVVKKYHCSGGGGSGGRVDSGGGGSGSDSGCSGCDCYLL